MQVNQSTEIDAGAEPAAAIDLLEQPGGRIALVDGAPIRGSSVPGETWSAFGMLVINYGWLGPLAEAAIFASINDQAPARATVLSPWGDDGSQVFQDKEKHDAYKAHVRAQVEEKQSWLWKMFESARASLLISPQAFTFMLSNRPGVQWDVPGLLPATALTPFVEQGEPAH